MTMFTSFEVSEVMGCWFRSISRPSSHSDAEECVCGCRARSTTSLLALDLFESLLLLLVLLGGYPWIVILVEARRPPLRVGVRVPEEEAAEEMEAGTTLDTTLETVERSTVMVSGGVLR